MRGKNLDGSMSSAKLKPPRILATTCSVTSTLLNHSICDMLSTLDQLELRNLGSYDKKTTQTPIFRCFKKSATCFLSNCKILHNLPFVRNWPRLCTLSTRCYILYLLLCLNIYKLCIRTIINMHVKIYCLLGNNAESICNKIYTYLDH